MRNHVRRLLARGDEPLVDGRILEGVVGARVEAEGEVDVTRNHLSLLSHPIRDAHVYRDVFIIYISVIIRLGLILLPFLLKYIRQWRVH